MSERLNIANERNYGFWNEAEQEALKHAKVAIAGAGGDGFQLGMKLAMMGIGNFSIADPEVFEPENSNRVIGAQKQNLGKNKALAFQEMAESLPRDINIDIFQGGVNEDNVEEFMHGADIVLDESELRYQHIGTMLGRTAAKLGIPELLVLNIGFAGAATSFKPNEKQSGFERMMNIDPHLSYDEIKDMPVRYDRAIPYIPGYGAYESFEAVLEGAPLPSVSQGVDVASAIGSTETFLHLTSNVANRRRTPTWSPKWRYMDAYTNKSGTIRHARLGYMRGGARLFAQEKLGIGPSASYSKDDIEARKIARSSTEQ